ncbi:MAG TPA: hypothetical protein VL651_02385 [Bacteroidia bacterium]|jgi:hypothetical protein|nr:hypothetical protein [Bacteroidia bacterium]
MKILKSILLILPVFLFAECRSGKEIKDDFILTDCSKTETLTMTGTFQRKNIYIENPMVKCLDSSMTFTTKQVIINDSIDTKDEINSTAYEIDLIHMNFKSNDRIEIRIIYISGFPPKVLNPEVE